jgi:hypothetical protein
MKNFNEEMREAAEAYHASELEKGELNTRHMDDISGNFLAGARAALNSELVRGLYESIAKWRKLCDLHNNSPETTDELHHQIHDHWDNKIPTALAAYRSALGQTKPSEAGE